MKIPETKRVIPKGFELGTIESGAPNENIVQKPLRHSIVKRILYLNGKYRHILTP